MGRPAKPVSLSSAKISKDERKARAKQEQILRGDNDQLKPPSYMTKEAKKVFKWLIEETQEAKTFGNIDRFVLEQFSNTYATYKELEVMLQKEHDFEKKEKIDRMKKRYTDALPRLYNELGLTPSTRAKLGLMNLKKQEDESDPVLQLLEKMKR